MAKQYLFNNVPTIHRRRTPFNLGHKNFTSMNVGDLVPILVQEVYPGDDFKIDCSFIARTLSEYIRPVMDTLYLDKYFFFVPNRLLLADWSKVMGESDRAWSPSKSYYVPTVSNENSVVKSCSLADYMGIPVGDYTGKDVSISVLPFRAYALIYNDWFRDQNTEPPINVKTSGVESDVFNPMPFSATNYLGMPAKVNKFHDYFTSALPSPQKGDSVSLSLGSTAPIVGDSTWFNFNGSLISTTTGSSPLSNANLARRSDGKLGVDVSGSYDEAYLTSSFKPSDLAKFLSADLSTATSADVNDLRTATQLQRMLERDARSGTRYIEYIRSAFGVDAGDYRLQRPEFIGGRRVPLSVQQVPQTVNNDSEKEFVGSLGAYSLSFGNAKARKGFVEHGFIIGVACIRQKHTYQQGIEKFWSRTERVDFYDPVFQNLGEQPIYQSEIYSNAVNSATTVFGYQEAWADLRQRPNRVSGAMRSHGASADLDIWHFADDFGSAPVLNSAFLKETEDNVNRALRVPHTTDNTPQFIVEFQFDITAVRCLPGHSVPGLLDHN